MSDYQKLVRDAENKKLEDALEWHLKRLKITGYERQAMFHPTRQWRADFLWGPPAMLMVEVDGGTYTGGRHTRGKGFEEDREKDHAAAILGFTPLHFTARQVTSGDAAEVIKTYLSYYGSANQHGNSA